MPHARATSYINRFCACPLPLLHVTCQRQAHSRSACLQQHKALPCRSRAGAGVPRAVLTAAAAGAADRAHLKEHGGRVAVEQPKVALAQRVLGGAQRVQRQDLAGAHTHPVVRARAHTPYSCQRSGLQTGEPLPPAHAPCCFSAQDGSGRARPPACSTPREQRAQPDGAQHAGGRAPVLAIHEGNIRLPQGARVTMQGARAVGQSLRSCAFAPC